MKQLNKQRTVNTYELEIYIKNKQQKEKNDKRANQLLFVCLLFAFYGLFTLVQPRHDSSSSYTSEMSILPTRFTNRNINTSNLVQTDFVAQEKTKHHKTVFIHGHKAVNKTLEFVIDSFDKKAKYFIDFGDGTQRIAKSKTIKYSYDDAGIYKVSLEVFYEGKSKKIFAENLKIKPWTKMD